MAFGLLFFKAQRVYLIRNLGLSGDADVVFALLRGTQVESYLALHTLPILSHHTKGISFSISYLHLMQDA